jgi:hypothetical protein
VPVNGDTLPTCAEVIQMCANAASCVIFQDRNGALHIERLKTADSGYMIPASLAYAHQEIELSKQLKSVSVSYGENLNYLLGVGYTGETQTVGDRVYATTYEVVFNKCSHKNSCLALIISTMPQPFQTTSQNFMP